MAFALRTRPLFKVFVVHRIEYVQELIGGAEDGYFAGMVAVLAGSDSTLLACEEAQRAGIRVVLLKRTDPCAAVDAALADVSLPGTASPAEWIEALRIITVRKRGPKKMLRTRVAPVGECVECAA
jgi:hypothetical protein